MACLYFIAYSSAPEATLGSSYFEQLVPKKKKSDVLSRICMTDGVISENDHTNAIFNYMTSFFFFRITICPTYPKSVWRHDLFMVFLCVCLCVWNTRCLYRNSWLCLFREKINSWSLFGKFNDELAKMKAKFLPVQCFTFWCHFFKAAQLWRLTMEGMQRSRAK